MDISLNYRPVHTRLREALKAIVRPSNNTRLRSELARASHEFARNGSNGATPESENEPESAPPRAHASVSAAAVPASDDGREPIV